MMIMQKMKFSQQLEYYRERSGFNKSALAEKMGLKAPTYVMKIESGREKAPTIERCEQIAKILNLSPEEKKEFIDTAMEERLNTEQLQWVSEKNKVTLVPIISWVNANQFGTIEDPFPRGSSDEFIPSTIKGENVFALKIKNDCMFNPSEKRSFSEGETIIIQPDVSISSGDFVIIRDAKSQEATFKQLIKRGKKTILHPLNPKYPDIELDDDERYEVIGKVVWKGMRVDI